MQQFLSDNDDLLRQHGLLYPTVGRFKRAHYGLSSILGFDDALKRERLLHSSRLQALESTGKETRSAKASNGVRGFIEQLFERAPEHKNKKHNIDDKVRNEFFKDIAIDD